MVEEKRLKDIVSTIALRVRTICCKCGKGATYSIDKSKDGKIDIRFLCEDCYKKEV